VCASAPVPFALAIYFFLIIFTIYA